MAVRRGLWLVSLILTQLIFDVSGAPPVLGIRCTMRLDFKWECKCNKSNIVLDVMNLEDYMLHCGQNAELDLMERVSKRKKETKNEKKDIVKTVKPTTDPLKLVEEEIKRENKENNKVDVAVIHPNPEVKVHPSVVPKHGHVLPKIYNHPEKHEVHRLHKPVKNSKVKKGEIVEIPDLTELANKPHVIHVAPPKKCHFMGKTYEDGSLTFRTRSSKCKLRCHHGNFVPGDCSEGEPQRALLISRSGGHLHVNKNLKRYR